MSKILPDAHLITVPHEISPRPSWVVERNPVDIDVTELGSPQSYSLLDYQVSIGIDNNSSYQRMCVQVHDESCIENTSQFLYNLVPGSQRIYFHRCVILRGEKTLDCLDLDNIRFMRRETELERHVSSDQLTVELIIDDLRVGDSIDIETTIVETRGEHPLYGRFFYSSFRASWGVPVGFQSVRVINNAVDQNVVIQHLDTAQSIDNQTVLSTDAVFEKQWTKLTPQAAGTCLPAHYWPPYLMVTSEADWNSVSVYLYGYYAAQGVVNTVLDTSGIEELDCTEASDEAILLCIRFVQDSIRYRSETSGIFSHTPKIPSVTLKRRTGDCKDKSNLLVALLAKIGVKAELALVNTSLLDAVDMLTPSPFLFNHMIVKISWEGQHYYVDVTQQKQGGELKTLAALTYRKALILSPEGAGLDEIPFNKDACVFDLQHIFDFRSESDSSPTVEVVRNYYRNRANNMRYYLASIARNNLEGNYQEELAEELGVKLKAIEPVHVSSDNTVENVLCTREKYRIETPLNEIGEGHLSVITNFYADLQISSSDDNPVAVEHDGVMEHHIQILYDNEVKTNEDQFKCANDWFSYEDKIVVNDKVLNFHMRLTPGEPIVPIDKLDDYREDYKSVQGRSSSRFVVINETHKLLGRCFFGGTVLLLLIIAALNDSIGWGGVAVGGMIVAYSIVDAAFRN